MELASTRAYGDSGSELETNRSVILDFEVDDVDAEYERLQESVSDWVMPLKVMLWGAPALSSFAIRTEILSICFRVRDGRALSLNIAENF